MIDASVAVFEVSLEESEDSSSGNPKEKKKSRSGGKGKTPKPAKYDTLQKWLRKHHIYTEKDVGGNITKSDVGKSTGLGSDGARA
jgi:hypothetical protein